jgi:DNA-binding MarR family transcriptional regulator
MPPIAIVDPSAAESGAADPSARSVLTRHSGFLLAQLGRAATRRYRSAMAPIGLNPRETYVLVHLRETGPVSQQGLGCTLEIDASNLVALLNELEAGGLISRRRDPEDRRRHVVEISPAGAETVDRVMETAEEVEQQLFASLEEGERVVLHDLLARVAEGAELSWPPADSPGEEGC